MAKTVTTKKSVSLKLKPLAGYALIEPGEELKRTAAGLYIPDTASQDRPQEGKVLAVGKPRKGEDGKLEEAEFEVGDTVIYKKWGGDELKIENKEYKLVEFKDVIAIVEK